MLQSVLPEGVAADLDGLKYLPGTLNFDIVAPFLNQENGEAVRRQYERGTLSVRVVEQGARLVILKNDLAKWLVDGLRQVQPPIKKRAPRNIFGRNGDPAKPKIGRPRKAESVARKTQQGG
jgi:hypothetical protein